MTVLKVDFVGIRTSRLDETVALFRDVLGVRVAGQSDDSVRFRLADNTLLELYGPGDEFHAFFATGPVVAFRVNDFAIARQVMADAGVEFIGEIQTADGVSWQDFYSPDGTILELIGPTSGRL
ncbi:MAG: VOC family protein [Hyphomicrobiales bacterium]|nr:VOC family protein [Hyphomicrobiales bacterium]MBV8441655.1 VOC family protein [Hyphomicrobiales bacterium]